MSYIKILLLDFRRSIINPLLLFMIILTASFFILSGYEELVLYAPQIQHIDTLHFFDFLRNVGVFETMIIICCVIPYGTSFCTDYSTSYLKLLKVRTGENKYIHSRMFFVFFSGALGIFIGIILFILIILFKYPLVDVNGGAYQSILIRASLQPLAFEELLLNGDYVSYFLFNILVISLICGLWSTIGLLISSIIPNPFVTIFSPYILYFSQSILLKKFPIEFNSLNIIKCNFDFGSTIKNLFFILSYVIIIYIIILFLFSYFCKRRMRDELY